MNKKVLVTIIIIASLVMLFHRVVVGNKTVGVIESISFPDSDHTKITFKEPNSKEIVLKGIWEDGFIFHEGGKYEICYQNRMARGYAINGPLIFDNFLVYVKDI